MREAVLATLADAGMSPGDIDVVLADGAGDPGPTGPRHPSSPACAVRTGADNRPKSMTGRLYSGGAPLDLAAALLSIRDGVIPPTTNTRDPQAEYQLDLVVGVPRTTPVRSA